MNKKISDKDKKDWENFLSNKESLPDKDKEFKNKIQKLIKLDLHGFTLTEANKKISNIIKQSYSSGVRKILVVTGKGLHSQIDKDPYISKDFGILKHAVPDFIKRDNELMKMIMEIKDAEIKDGGSGAFYIFLKKKL